jgi:hypothetical protein
LHPPDPHASAARIRPGGDALDSPVDEGEVPNPTPAATPPPPRPQPEPKHPARDRAAADRRAERPEPEPAGHAGAGEYGSATLDDLEALCAEAAEELGLAIDFRQTNGEGELITWVQECRGRAAAS